MSLEQAVRDYLRFIDTKRGDDYSDDERRSVRMPLDVALREESQRESRLRAAALALVRVRFDWSFSIADEADQDRLDEPFEELLLALGVTEAEIEAPGRARSEAMDAECRAREEVEHTRRRALTQDERDAEDAKRWNAMNTFQQHLFVMEMQMYGGGDFKPSGSLDGTFGSFTPWPIKTGPWPFAVYEPLDPEAKPWNEAPFFSDVIVYSNGGEITNISAAPEAPKAHATRITIDGTDEVLWQRLPIDPMDDA